MTLILFGLTGGIACGKSTVASFLKKRGLAVIDADEMARQAVAPGTRGLKKIVERFGADLVNQQGHLDRKKMAGLVFADRNARLTLEKLLHPLVQEQTRKRAQELANKGHHLAAYEAALLVEKGLADKYRPLVVVTAPQSLQLQRLIDRDGLSDAEARSRLAAQMPVEDKAKAADHVIDTGASLSQVEARTHATLQKICSDLGVEPDRYLALCQATSFEEKH